MSAMLVRRRGVERHTHILRGVWGELSTESFVEGARRFDWSAQKVGEVAVMYLPRRKLAHCVPVDEAFEASRVALHMLASDGYRIHGVAMRPSKVRNQARE